MTQATTYSVSPLLGQDVITTNATPLMSYCNIYNATSGALAPVLRQASLGTLGTTCLVEKYVGDTSGHAVTVTCHSGETFFDGTTTRVLTDPGSFIELAIVAGSDNVAKWKVVGTGFSDLTGRVPWSGGAVGILPATSGQHLTTQGGNTLDDGSGNVVIQGGNLNGVTIVRAEHSTAASSTPIVMTAASAQVQTIVGTTTGQIVKLPTTSIPAGYECIIINQTSGANVTVQGSSGTTIATLAPGEMGVFRAKYDSPLGALYWLQSGSHLEGVTIGSTTPAVAINTATLKQSGAVAVSGSTFNPWLNQSTGFSGNFSGSGGAYNYFGIADQVNNTGSGILSGLQTLLSVGSPSIGGRVGIFGQVYVSGAGTQTPGGATYVGVAGRGEIDANLGGTGMGNVLSGAYPIGQVWGGWFFGASQSGATNLALVWGVEIDVAVPSGSSVFDKVGLGIILADPDAVQGTVNDAALQIMRSATVTTTWKNGIQFGTEVATVNTPNHGYLAWPFDTASTLIRAAGPGTGTNNAGTGIDFTNVTFAGPAITVGAAPIAMAEMASAPSGIASTGQFYVASDGSAHYLSPGGTDTQLAPA